jgi:hypothetical protein
VAPQPQGSGCRRIRGSEAAPILGAVLGRFPKGHDSSARWGRRAPCRDLFSRWLSLRAGTMIFGFVEEDGARSIYIVQCSVSVAHSTLQDIYIDERHGFAKLWTASAEPSERHIRLAPQPPWAIYRFLARSPSK